MNEAEVLLKTNEFLKRTELLRQKVLRLYTDAHASLLKHRALAPFQRFTLDFGDFVMHPDLVGQLDDGETIFAIEAKGEPGHGATFCFTLAAARMPATDAPSVFEDPARSRTGVGQ